MFITKKYLSRRAVLRGAVRRRDQLAVSRRHGACRARAATPPQLRFGAVYVPNGIRPEIFTPPRRSSSSSRR